MNGTPLPHEEPQELNPPAGVVAYYWLQSAASGPLKLELVDAKGTVRACLASDTPVSPVDTEAINVQAIWEQPAPPPSATLGMHRAMLNVRTVRGGGGGGARGPKAPDACTPASAQVTPAAAPAQVRGRSLPVLQPGEYSVRMTLNGEVYTQPVTIEPDPRGLPAAAETQAQ
jgi:hypothetical protein